MCVSESQIPECFCKGKGGLLRYFLKAGTKYSLCITVRSASCCVERAEPLSHLLPCLPPYLFMKREQQSQRFYPFYAFFMVFQKVYANTYISKCVPGISAHVPYFIFISPGAVRPKSHYTILFTNVKKITLKTHVNLQIGKKTSGWTWTVLTAVCGLVTGNPAD